MALAPTAGLVQQVSGKNTILISTDGYQYTGLGSSVFTIRANNAAWNGNIWVAGGAGGNSLAYSYDGVTWTGLGTLIFTEVTHVAWHKTMYVESLWIATGIGSENTLAYSYNGISWYGVGKDVFSVKATSSTTNGIIILATGQGGNTLARSIEGFDWYTNTEPIVFTTAAYKAIWGGQYFVAVGEGTNTIAYSTDSINWTGIGTSIFDSVGYDVAWNGSRYVAVGLGTVNTIAYSDDGVNWTGCGTSVFTEGRSVTFNGRMFVASGQGPSTLAISSDGIQWQRVDQETLIANGTGFGANPGVGAVIPDSQLIINKQSQIDFVSDNYIDMATHTIGITMNTTPITN